LEGFCNFLKNWGQRKEGTVHNAKNFGEAGELVKNRKAFRSLRLGNSQRRKQKTKKKEERTNQKGMPVIFVSKIESEQ